MKDLDLLQLLRYGFAGGIFLAALLLVHWSPEQVDPDRYFSAPLVAAAAFMSLAAGSTIYSLHRAVPYPILNWIVLKATHGATSAMELDIRRWTYLEDKKQTLLPRLVDWAAQVHFLYCASWALVLAVWTGRLIGLTPHKDAGRVVWVTSGFLLLAAMAHHVRCILWERRVLQVDAKARS
jgi:hypothetical protein